MTQTWKEVLKEEQIFKTNWSAYGEELLKKYIICGGKPVILQVTFNGCSWVKNQLIFKASRFSSYSYSASFMQFTVQSAKIVDKNKFSLLK